MTFTYPSHTAKGCVPLSSDVSNEQTRKTTPIFDWSEDDFNFNVNTKVSGNLNVSGTLTINNTSIFDLLYPVDSIYISVNSANPSALFGGTWEQIKDIFLLAAGTTYAGGSTGGEAAHTLTEDEIPAHRHKISYPNASGEYGDAAIGYPTNSGTTKTWGAEMCKTESVGGGAAHNNMPPYLAVYMWKRTA